MSSLQDQTPQSLLSLRNVRGYNSRLNPLHTAVLAVKLQYFIARRYLHALVDTPLSLPLVPDCADPAWHLCIVQSDHRDSFAAALGQARFPTLIQHPVSPHLQPAYADITIPAGMLPIAELLAKRVLSLPIGPQLTMQAVDEVIHHFRALTSRQPSKVLG